MSAFLIISTICLHSQVFYTEQGKFGIGFSGSTDYPIYDLQLKATTPTFVMHTKAYNNNVYLRMVEDDNANDEVGINYLLGTYIKYDGSNNKLVIGGHNSYNQSTSSDVDIFSINRSTGHIVFDPIDVGSMDKNFITYVDNDYSISYCVSQGTGISFGVYGNGGVVCLDVYEYSDSTLKTDIETISNSYDLISKLRPVKYHFKEDKFDENGNVREKVYGLIAQEVEEVIPSAVITTEGKKGISYSSIIPLLINAIQDQQKEIEQIKSQLASSASAKGAIKESDLVITDMSTLSQNIPNPFSDITRIKYNIHEINSQAMINIYDLQGKQIQTHLINSEGQGEILIPGSELNPGIYIYNLIVDGMEIDSKRMVLTN